MFDRFKAYLGENVVSEKEYLSAMLGLVLRSSCSRGQADFELQISDCGWREGLRLESYAGSIGDDGGR